MVTWPYPAKKEWCPMSPRLTDWSLALAAVLAFVTGVVSLISGLPQDWFIFVLHGIVGLWLLLLLWGKLRRVWPRLIHPRRWDRRTIYALLALLLVTLALVSGIWWVRGGNWYFAGFNLLNWHIVLGFVVTAAIAFHMLARAKRLRKRDISGRRRALHFSVLLLGSAALGPAPRPATSPTTSWLRWEIPWRQRWIVQAAFTAPSFGAASVSGACSTMPPCVRMHAT